MSVKDDAKLILKDVAKGLVSIVVPPGSEKKPEFMQLHWCEKCKKYHASN